MAFVAWQWRDHILISELNKANGTLFVVSLRIPIKQPRKRLQGRLITIVNSTLSFLNAQRTVLSSWILTPSDAAATVAPEVKLAAEHLDEQE